MISTTLAVDHKHAYAGYNQKSEGFVPRVACLKENFVHYMYHLWHRLSRAGGLVQGLP